MSALLGKELRRFASNSMIILNSALGSKSPYSRTTPIAKRAVSYGAELGLNLRNITGMEKFPSLWPFARYEYYNPQEEVITRQAADEREKVSMWTAGLNWRALPNLVFKADYTTSDSLETIIPGLKEQKYVMDVDYPKELMESINSNIRKISIILLAVALLLTFVSFVLINNTMRLSIYARRFSIRTMQLVGAKPSFIRRPFMSNAFWVGFISAMFACALLVFGIDSLVRFDPSMAKVVTWEIVAITMGTVFGCGIILILLCAYFSVNKYLRMRADDIYRA